MDDLTWRDEATKNYKPSPAAPDELPQLLKAYALLSDRIIKAAEARFKTGEIVHWLRRDHRQRGEVNAVLGFQAHNLKLRVLNTATGRMVELYLYEIEELRK